MEAPLSEPRLGWSIELGKSSRGSVEAGQARQTPNPDFQSPRKFQSQSFKYLDAYSDSGDERNLDFPEIWCLEFGISAFSNCVAVH
jgi:hypothetical protein